ncbi:MAG: hypothetical protein LC648_00540 [Novosphingobium sp.]|nr:hypothetical protein [Novosphingobium sp.]
MTTLAAELRPTRRGRPPLTAHRWFPAAVALWFAALFALCSLAVPPAMLERLVGALGVDRVIAAAAPPLGETARLLIVLALSIVGEIVGLLAGRGIAARHGRQGQDRPSHEARHEPPSAGEASAEREPQGFCPDAPRKPLSAADDLAGLGSFEQSAADGDMADALLEERAQHQCAQAEASASGTSDGPFEAPGDAADDAPARIAPAEPTDASLAPLHAELASASLESLGVVQLSERLALAMRARRAGRVSEAMAGAPSRPTTDANRDADEPHAGDDRPTLLPMLRTPFSAADPAAAERVRRAALASLERISGAR